MDTSKNINKELDEEKRNAENRENDKESTYYSDVFQNLTLYVYFVRKLGKTTSNIAIISSSYKNYLLNNIQHSKEKRTLKKYEQM